MAFSGSRDYTESYTAASIIERALKHLGILDASESVPTAEQTDALEQLNLLIKEWGGQDAGVWVRETGHLFLTDPGTSTFYTLGTGGTAKFTSLYYTTTLSAAASSGAATVTVTDDTNISDTDIILVQMDDGTLHATTVSGAPAANVVTLADVTDDDAASGNIVYSWPTTSNITHMMANLVFAARRQTDTDNAATNAGYMEGIDSPIEIIGEQQYRFLSSKFNTGIPTHIYHERRTLNPKIHVWPTGGNTPYHSIVIQFQTFLQDLDATDNNIDIPPQGVNALTWCLAAELAPEYGIPTEEQLMVTSRAERKREDFFDSVVEDASLIFEREERGG